MHKCSHPRTRTQGQSSSVPALHLACSHILRLSHTEHADQLWVNMSLCALSLFLSLSLFIVCSPPLLSSVPPSFPSPWVVTYLVKILISCLQIVRIVLSHTFQQWGGLRKPGKRAVWVCVCVPGGGRGVSGECVRERQRQNMTEWQMRRQPDILRTHRQTQSDTSKNKHTDGQTYTQRIQRKTGVKTLNAHKTKYCPGIKGNPQAERQRKEIKLNMLTELIKIQREPYNRTARLLCVGYGHYQPSVCVCVRPSVADLIVTADTCHSNKMSQRQQSINNSGPVQSGAAVNYGQKQKWMDRWDNCECTAFRDEKRRKYSTVWR